VLGDEFRRDGGLVGFHGRYVTWRQKNYTRRKPGIHAYYSGIYQDSLAAP
jgi:hypothetical protein